MAVDDTRAIVATGELPVGEAPLNPRPAPRLCLALTILTTLLTSSGLGAQTPDSTRTLTLEAALNEARAHNAELPIARGLAAAAVARAGEARAQLYPTLSGGGDVHTGAPQDYASSDAFLGVFGHTPLYEGGELRANVAQANAEATALDLQYRVGVRELDQAVRASYSRLLHALDGLTFRERGIERLQAYLQVIEARRLAGQGVGLDRLRTQQRLAAARADIATAEREVEDARMELNDLLGRAPADPLEVSAMPAPAQPSPAAGAPWGTLPDVAQSDAEIQASAAALQAAQAGRKVRLSLDADVGVQPHVGSDVALMNNGTGAGAEVTLSVSLPFWDAGIYRNRIAEADANLGVARDQAVATRRNAQMNWSRAAASVASLYREYEARTQAASVAEDAYLQAESLYRGGQGGSLDVLDAYDAWIQALQDQLDAIYGYRVANANLIRWGGQ